MVIFCFQSYGYPFLYDYLILTWSLKSAAVRQLYPNSILIPNCTPVMGIGAPTLYVNLSKKKLSVKNFYNVKTVNVVARIFDR